MGAYVTKRQTNRLSILYNREQVPNPRHHWSDENFPVTKLTGRNVRLAKLSDLKIHVINNSFLDEVDEKNSHFF